MDTVVHHCTAAVFTTIAYQFIKCINAIAADRGYCAGAAGATVVLHNRTHAHAHEKWQHNSIYIILLYIVLLAAVKFSEFQPWLSSR